MNAALACWRAIYFGFGGTIASFAAFATRNFTTFLAGILIDSPVNGLRPVRTLRSTRTKRPMPGIANTPDVSERSAISDSIRASCLETPSLFAVSRTEGNGVSILARRAILPSLYGCRGELGTLLVRTLIWRVWRAGFLAGAPLREVICQ